jgi:predicted ATPase
MSEAMSLEELDRRIAIVRENLRQLIEQAAARSGAADEALASERIMQQSEELDRLTKERDALQAAQSGSKA